jgi:hypothetical protein
MANIPDKNIDKGPTEKGTSISGHDAPDRLPDTERVSSPALSVHNEKDEQQTKPPQKKAIAAEQEHDGIEDGQRAVEPPSEELNQGTATPGEDFSIFTVRQKKLMIMTASLASLFSPMATAIYCQYQSPTFNYNSWRIIANLKRSIT